MRHHKGLGQLGLLTVGLGFGAAIVCTPGVASADVFDFDPNNFAVSIDGLPLFQEGSATASSVLGSIAIADGANSNANATGGIFDSASAFGVGTAATADNGSVDSAFAYGNGSMANANTGFFDSASADGTSSIATADDGNVDIAFATGTSSDAVAGGDAATTSSFDLASATGTNAEASALLGASDQAFANGNGSEAFAEFGSGNLASVFGAGSVDRAGGTILPGMAAVLGNNDVAEIFGNNDIAEAGANFATPGDFDLAAIFGSDLGPATAIGSNFLVEILPNLF